MSSAPGTLQAGSPSLVPRSPRSKQQRILPDVSGALSAPELFRAAMISAEAGQSKGTADVPLSGEMSAIFFNPLVTAKRKKPTNKQKAALNTKRIVGSSPSPRGCWFCPFESRTAETTARDIALSHKASGQARPCSHQDTPNTANSGKRLFPYCSQPWQCWHIAALTYKGPGAHKQQLAKPRFRGTQRLASACCCPSRALLLSACQPLG